MFFEGFNDYLAVMTYNLGALVSGLEGRPSTALDTPLTLFFGGLVGILAIVVILESIVLYKRESA